MVRQGAALVDIKLLEEQMGRLKVMEHSSQLRLKTARFQDTTLFLAFSLWLCTLPLLALLALPFLGWQLTASLAGLLLILDLFGCWLLCVFRLPKNLK